ncbi:MAG TPA: DUF6325 family protein [Candidatus Saccharimonadales bacterium]
MRGPVDYIIVGFNGNNFDGGMLKEITEAEEKGIIRVLDLLFIIKDRTGAIAEGEYADQTNELKETFGDFTYQEDTPLLTDDDVAQIGEQMQNDSAAAILIVEHTWAKGLKRAILNAGGFLIADGRIHAEKVEQAVTELATIQ